MSNPYNQFNIRFRPDARLPGLPADISGGRLNFHSPILGTVRLLAPTVSASGLPYAGQRLYGTPTVATNDGTNFNAFGQLFGTQNPAYMPNCHCGTGIPAPAVIQFGMGNQSMRLPQPTNFPGVMGMRMCSSGQATDLMPQYVAGYTTAMLRNHVPVMRPDAASVQHAYNVPAFPVVSVIPTNTVNTLHDNVNIPFREVPWFPAGLQQTGVPQVPYALEIKPDNCDGFAPVIDATFTVPVTGSSCKPECADAPPEPAVYLDIAMESSEAHLNANKRTADTHSFHSYGTAAKATKKTGRQTGNSRKSRPGVLKLPPVKPCSVSLVRIDSSGVVRPRSNDSVEVLSDDTELTESEPNEPEANAGLVPEVPEVVADADQELSKELTEPEFEPELAETEFDPSSVPEAQEVLSNAQTPVPVIEEEIQEKASSEHDFVIQENVSDSDSDQLIGSDEDVGEDCPPHDNNDCPMNDDNNVEKPAIYEVTTNSDALLFDMECDGEKAGEALRVLLPTKPVTPPGQRVLLPSKQVTPPGRQVPLPTTQVTSTGRRVLLPTKLLPTKQVTPTGRRTASTKKKYSLPKTHKSKQVGRILAASDSNVITIPIDLDADDEDDDIIIASESPPPTANASSVFSRMLRTAASACKEKISATQTRFESVEISRCENAFIGVPLQSSFFRFEAQSMEVYRLLSMEKSFVPSNILTQLMDLVASVDATAVGSQPSGSDAPSGSVSRIPHGGSRTLMFQCLFCPYGELSAKRIMAHVKQKHQMYAPFIQRSLLPSRRVLLFIYCRHCNFIAYDSAAMFIHFATYHKVPGILLAQPKDIEQDPDWAPMIDPESNAREFPFYACPNCRYLDAEWNRMIQHMLKKHASESIFFGCVVRLIMFGRSSKYIGSFTYQSLAKQERCKVARRYIYACVSCHFFSFYPTYAFCHYVINHSCLEMLYVCAASPSCTKRCTSVEDVISHIQDVHVAMKTLQFRCSATLFDALISTEVNFSPGELEAADVPVNVNYQSSFGSVRNSTETAIEIKDDDDDDDDLDVVADRSDAVMMNPACEDDKSNDVEPESDEECTVNDSEATELPSDSAAVKQNVPTRDTSEPSCSGQASEKIVPSCGADETDADIVLSSDDEASVVELNDANTNSVCSVADDQNMEADSNCRVEAEASEIIDCEVIEQDLNRVQPQSAENSSDTRTSGTLVTELVNSAYPGKDANPIANDAATVVADFENSRSEESEQDLNAAESQSVQNASSTGISGTSTAELVNSDMNSTFPGNDVNPSPDAAVADFENSQCEASEQDLHGAKKDQSVENPLSTGISEVARTGFVNSDMNSTLLSTDASTLADSAVTVADFENSEREATEQDLESQSVLNPLSGTTHTELVNSDANSAFSSNVADPLADSAASAGGVENCRCEVSEQRSVQSPLSTGSSETSLTELANSAVNSALSTMDADPQADSADVVNHVDVPCSNDGSSSGSTELELVQDDGTGRSESVNSAEDPTFSSRDPNQLTETVTAGADDLTNHTSVAADDESAAGSAVLCPDELSSQEVFRSCTVTEGEVVNPPLMDTSTAEQELFTSDRPDSIKIFNELLDFDDELLSSSELPSDQRCMMDLDEDLLLLPVRLTVDEIQHPDQSSTPELAASMCSMSSEDIANDDSTRDSLIVSADDPCLPRSQDTSNDTLCCDVTENEQLHTSFDSLPDAGSKPVQGHGVDEILVPPYASCSSEILSEGRDLEVTQPVESSDGQAKVSDSGDKPVNRQRCKSLASFRFPVSSSFTTKPS